MKFGNHIDLGLNELQNALIQKLGSDPAGQSSRIYYNTGSNVLKYHNGTEWVTIAGTPNLQEVLNIGSAASITTGFTVATSNAIVLNSVLNTSVGSAAGTTISAGTDILLSAANSIKLNSFGSGTFESTYVSILASQNDGTVVEVDPSDLITIPNLQSVTDEGNTTSNSILIDTGATGLAFRVRGEIDGSGEDLFSVSHNAVEVEPNTTFNQDVYADGITSKTLSNPFIINSTGGLRLPEGTTAQRPTSPNEGLFRYNSTTKRIEGYSSISSLAANADMWFDVPMQISDSTAFTDTLIIAPSAIFDG